MIAAGSIADVHARVVDRVCARRDYPGAPVARLRLALVVGLLIAACASPIETDHAANPEVDFSRFATFAWIGERPLPDAGAEGTARRISSVTAERLRAAVEAELQAKGYEPAAPEGADLLVAYSVGREQVVREEQVAGRTTVITPGPGGGSWYRSSPVRIRTHTEGTLTLQLLDRASRQAVWVGWGSKRVTGSEPSEEIIRRAVAEILARLPRHAGRGDGLEEVASAQRPKVSERHPLRLVGHCDPAEAA